jgi:hypothetical protein
MVDFAGSLYSRRRKKKGAISDEKIFDWFD